MKHFYKPILLVFFLAICQLSEAATDVKSKKITKSFAATNETILQVENQFGNINCIPWSKDSVKIVIDITVKNKSQDRTSEILEKIKANISASTIFINAKTEFDDDGSVLKQSINKIADFTLSGMNNGVQINYSIYLPETIELKLKNKFGNINIQNHSGRMYLQNNYGDTRIGTVTGYLNLDIKFGNLNAFSIQRASINADFSTIIINDIQNADFNTKSTKISIQNAERIRCRSKRDDYTLYKIADLDIDGSYSNVIISELSNSVNFSGKYGNITIHQILASFSLVRLNCESSNANLNIADESSFILDVHLEEGDLTYPSNITSIKKSSNSDEKATYYGTVGNKKTANSRLEVFGEKTFINLSIR